MSQQPATTNSRSLSEISLSAIENPLLPRTTVQDDPILKLDASRFILHPIRDFTVWVYYKMAFECIWSFEEVDLSRDLADWTEKLDEDERNYISTVLAFFAAADGIVNENLVQRFSSEVALPEARCFYGVQILMENVHSETYSNLLMTLVVDPLKRDVLFSAIYDQGSVAKKAKWAQKWIDSETSPFAIRLVAFAAVEGIFFSSSFAAIFWLKTKGVLLGLCFSNELIARDEGLHTEFACMLLLKLKHRPTFEAIRSIINEAVEIEKEFVSEALSRPLEGLNAELMHEYVEYVGDRLCEMLKVPKIYNTTNPLTFMDLISLDGKANFFERRVSAYRMACVHDEIVDELEVANELEPVDLPLKSF